MAMPFDTLRLAMVDSEIAAFFRRFGRETVGPPPFLKHDRF